MKTHCCSREFKLTAVKLASHPRIDTQEVAAALNIHPFMLSRWKKEVREGKLQGSAHPDFKEIEDVEATVPPAGGSPFGRNGVPTLGGRLAGCPSLSRPASNTSRLRRFSILLSATRSSPAEAAAAHAPGNH
jgi:hypothetical protein